MKDFLDPSLPLGNMKVAFRTRFMINLTEATTEEVNAILTLYPDSAALPILGGATTITLKSPPPLT